MSFAPLQARIDAAMDLAERAGEMAMSIRPEPGASGAMMKGPQNWVTEADGAMERFLSAELAIAFPSKGRRRRCKKVVRETASGARTERTQLHQAFDQFEAANVLL